jgi:flagellar hook-length control protein FliK
MSGQGGGLNNAAPTTLHAIDSAMRADVLNRAIVASAQDGVNVDSRVATNNTFSNTMAANGVSSVDDVSGAVPGLQRLNSIGVGYSPTLSVSTPVGQPGWAHDMAQRVTWLAGSELREAQLQLHPRNLGLVDVRIVYGHDQQLNVSFSAANPLARDALDAALPRLREMFEQQGLNLAGADISHESFAEREQGNDTGDKPVAFDGAVAEHTADELKIPMTAPLQMQGEGMLNLYA